MGTCPLIHPNYFSVMIFVSVTELTLTLNRPKNNSGELTDKHRWMEAGLIKNLWTNSAAFKPR